MTSTVYGREATPDLSSHLSDERESRREESERPTEESFVGVDSNRQQSIEDLSEQQSIEVKVIGSTSSTKVIEVETTSLRDVFESMGAWGLSSGGEGSRLELQIRGGGGQQSGLYIDDIPLHSLRSRSVDLRLFAVDLLESAELELGGDGAAQGSGAMTGSFRLLTPQPDTEPRQKIKLNASTQGFARLSALLVPKEHYGVNSLVAISLSGGPNAYAYVNQYGTHMRRENSSFHHMSALTKLETEKVDWRLKLSFGLGTLNRDEPGPETFSLPGRKSEQRALWLSASQQSPSWFLGDATVTLALHQSILYLRYFFEELNPLWQSQESAVSDFRDQRILTRAELVGQWPQLKLTVATEISETKALVTSTKRVKRTQGAMTPQLSWQLNRYLLWTFAYRADFNTERAAQYVPSTTLAFQSESLRPWRAWLTTSLVWRDPGFDERYLAGPGIIPNPELQPERGQWGELGIKKSLRVRLGTHLLRLTSSVRTFIQRYQEMIAFVPLDPYRVRAENLRGAMVSGNELNLRLSDSFRSYRVEAEFQGSILHHRTLNEPRAPLPLRPRQFGYSRLSLSTRLADGRVEGWLSGSARGEVSIDRFAERSLPLRLIPSIGLTRVWTLARSWHLSMMITNVSDQSSYDFALHPIAGRSIWFALSVE